MSDIKLKFIPISEVPASNMGHTLMDWNKFFNVIPEGQALVCDEKLKRNTIQHQLKRFQNNGRYNDYLVVARCKKVYIIHSKTSPSKEQVENDD